MSEPSYEENPDAMSGLVGLLHINAIYRRWQIDRDEDESEHGDCWEQTVAAGL